MAIAVAAACVVPMQLLAADCANPRKAAGGMSEGVYNGVQEATQLLTQQKHAQAISSLAKLAESGTDFDKAVVYYNMGFAYAGTEDYGNATQAFAKALALNVLPQQQHEQLQYNLGQLYIAAGKVDDGIRVLQAYLAESCGKIPADAHIFVANALSQAKRYREALPEIDKAIEKSGAPKESWLQLKLAISYELKDYSACARALVGLIGMAPAKPDYWKQLSSIFLQMKQDIDAVAVLALAERQGYIEKQNEIVNLYNVYMLMELPFKAGTLLQTGMDKGKIPVDESHLDMLSNAWINAREENRAEASLKKLASVAERGEYFYKLGAMYGDGERWKESKEALQKAIEKGGLKRTGEAWMRIAVANYNLKNIPGTQTALQQALKFDESRKQAGEWLRHLGGTPAPAPQEQVARSN
jgi:tetratricopeptide (TPR) repeat protein